MLIAALVGISAQASFGAMALIDPALPGNTQTDVWATADLTSTANPGYGSFPGSSAWPGGIQSGTPNVGSSGDAQLNRLGSGTFGGGPFPSGSSIYFGSFDITANINGGKLGVADSTPVANVHNIVLQVQIGEATGYDFFNHVMPVLNFNGGAQALAATTAITLEQFDTGTTFPAPGGDQPIFTNTYLLQWDTSALGAISSFSLDFNGVQHAQLYQLRLDQSDVFQAVPEPSSAALAGLAMMGVLGFVWKKRRTR
jgi:hypothetical protein